MGSRLQATSSAATRRRPSFHPSILPLTSLLLVGFVLSSPCPADTLDDVRKAGILTWGADAAEGGAPYVFQDPEHPGSHIGFEVDLMDAVAREMGVRAEFTQCAWDSLVPSLKVGKFALAVNGLEITDDRAQEIAFSKPYYIASEQITVRADNYLINALQDLKGKRVGTLKASLAERILAAEGGIEIKPYDGQNAPYDDLALGRIDAVLLDLPIAVYVGRPNPKLRMAGNPFGEARYGMGARKEDAALVAAVNDALDRLARSGELRHLYESWALWNEATARYLGDTRPGRAPAPKFDAFLKGIGQDLTIGRRLARYASYLPLLLTGAWTTVWLSVTSMALAVAAGIALAVARLYGPAWLSGAAAAYVEVVRGTPLLIQLYLLYYGLPNIGLQLPDVAAGILGLGLNYAAYEAENYRAGIQSVARTQTEAAFSLGLSAAQAFRHVVLPQAVRVSLPTVTNDFIALFKDSSIVSMIAIVELSNQSRQLSGSAFDYMGIGLMTAALYFGIGYPFAWLARRMERKLAVYVR